MARRNREELLAAGREARRKVESYFGADGTFDRCVKAEMARMEADGVKVNRDHVSLWVAAAERHIYPCKCEGTGTFDRKRKRRDKSNVCYACGGKGQMDPNACEKQAQYEARRKAS